MAFWDLASRTNTALSLKDKLLAVTYLGGAGAWLLWIANLSPILLSLSILFMTFLCYGITTLRSAKEYFALMQSQTAKKSNFITESPVITLEMKGGDLPYCRCSSVLNLIVDSQLHQIGGGRTVADICIVIPEPLQYMVELEPIGCLSPHYHIHAQNVGYVRLVFHLPNGSEYKVRITLKLIERQNQKIVRS